MKTPDITRLLNTVLGPTLVAAVASSRDPKASLEWQHRKGVRPTKQQATRLGVAYETWAVIASEHGVDVARVWVIGANPWRRYDTPVDAIREGRVTEVAAAARGTSLPNYRVGISRFGMPEHRAGTRTGRCRPAASLS